MEPILDVFFIRFPPSLKNSRFIFANRGGKGYRSLPSPRAMAFLNYAQGVLRNAYEKPPVSDPVFVLAQFAYSWQTAHPRFDLDNVYTTIQESLKGIVIDDDRQVRAAFPFLVRTAAQVSFVRVVVWTLTEKDTPSNILQRALSFVDLHSVSLTVAPMQVDRFD